METLVRFIVKLILFFIGFILCAWLFLDITPTYSWQKITGKVESLYTLITKGTDKTVQAAGETVQGASNLSQVLIDKTAEQIAKTTQPASESVQKTVDEF